MGGREDDAPRPARPDGMGGTVMRGGKEPSEAEGVERGCGADMLSVGDGVGALLSRGAAPDAPRRREREPSESVGDARSAAEERWRREYTEVLRR